MTPRSKKSPKTDSRGKGKMPDRGQDSLAPQELTDPDQPASALPFPVVGIGASAGGLEAFTEFLRAVPSDSGMAFVLVSHLSPSHPSHLAEILSRVTSLPVTEVGDEPAVEANRVYVIPPDRNMVISEGRLKLLPRGEIRGAHHPIDHFLQSLAETQGHRAIGVILSGTANDGTLGLEEVKAQGGITFAQDDTAQYDGMPRSAILAGSADFVLPPEAIAKELVRIARHSHVSPDGPDHFDAPADRSALSEILRLINSKLTVDFSHYKANTLHRRISRRMALHRIEALKDYVAYLSAHPQELVALFEDFLINVTSFFRNPEAFEVLKQRVFPRLLAGRTMDNPVRIWVVGCSTGEEAYSIAITLIEYMEQARITLPVQIFASDLNAKGIEKARAGTYPQSIADHVSPERLRRFFHEQDGRYQVNKATRAMCLFAQHNALTDPPFSRIDLLSCRNLLIYLEPVMQKRLLPLLHYGLKPEGVLWLGVSETVGGFRHLFEPEDVKHKMYTRKATTRVADLPIPLLDRPAPSEQPSKSASLEQLGFPPADPQREADRILLTRYSPPGVLVNNDLEILQFRGDTSPFLAPAAGKASLNLMKMLREGLTAPVRGGLAAAKQGNITVRKDGVPVLVDGKRTRVNVEVIPVKGNTAAEDCFLLLFQALDSDPGTRAQQEVRNRAAEDEAGHEATRLRQELTSSREYLQSVIEQQEAAYEELQSANEEVQSANEELQSINEELETAQEETQSSNEELATVNEELHNRNAELAETNNDLQNLLGSVQMSIIMLDRELRIRRFTPTAERMVNLLATDVGRPIGDINLNLNLPDLEAVVTDVIASVTPVQREVRDRAGHWYSIRVRPYMTRDNRIDGAVLVLVDIDSLKTTEESLRASEERYRIMYEQAPLGIFETDLDGRFVRVNDEFCRMTGRNRESLLTRRSRDITHPDDLAADIEAFRLLRSGEATSLQLQKRYLLDDGKPLWVAIHRFVITGPDGAPRFTVGVVEDIQERKLTEDALKESEARFRLLADSAPVLIWVNSLIGIEFVNRAYLDFLGADLSQVKGMGWTRFIHPADREQYLASLEDAMRRGERFEGQCRLRCHDGEYRSMLSVAMPRYEGDERVVGYVGCMVDVTEIKRAEESLRVADLKKNQFIALLAHELRNPLAPLRNVTTLLNSPGLEPRTLAWAHDVLNRQLRNITRMVDDLLDVSRITEEKIRLEVEPVVLADVIERSIEALRTQLEAGAKHLDVRLPHTPVYLDADPVRLEQIFTNLLGNAIKFTHRAGHIWVTAKLQSDRLQMVEIRIRDDGMGISSDLLPRIFDLFIQADTSLERTHGGLGIGLTLVKRMAELHGGTIEARSDGPGHGAEFIVRFPVLGQLPAGVEELPEAEAESVAGRDPLRILVVDDNVDAAEVISLLLRHSGHQVSMAHTGASALEEVRLFHPDVVLLDLGLPGMSGYDVARQIRASTGDGQPMLVAVSGYSGDDLQHRMAEAGFDEYIGKPFDLALLEEVIYRGRA